MKICGIDEAGRGPVIGPMVIAAVTIDEKDMKKLERLGVKDSKLLSPKRRDELFDQILKITSAKVAIVSPQQIDEAVFSSFNLNRLEAVTAASLIDESETDLVYMDCPSNNIESFTRFLNSHIKSMTKVIADHKADAKYPIVSAASIIAKVTRDREIDKIKARYRIEFGSGYPSDPMTVEFLKKNHGKYPFFRKSWSSYSNAAEKQSTLSGF